MSLPSPYAPVPLSGLDVAFPADVQHLMPSPGDIPEDFRRGTGDAARWVRFQQEWFFRGFPKGTRIKAKPGVDATAAMRHLAAIQGSFEPSHEDKESAVAFLASQWLVEPPGGAS